MDYKYNDTKRKVWGLVMWLVSDEAMKELLGGDFEWVIKQAQLWVGAKTIKDYSLHQWTYKSYNGFRKFFNKKIIPILDGVKPLNKIQTAMCRFIIGK